LQLSNNASGLSISDWILAIDHLPDTCLVISVFFSPKLVESQTMGIALITSSARMV
jgi:hypothetical protein